MDLESSLQGLAVAAISATGTVVGSVVWNDLIFWEEESKSRNTIRTIN